MDKVDKFVTIRDGDVVMRLDKDEAPVLREYAMPLAHQALTTLAQRYEFTPRGPILVEIFPKHDDFAVRTLGLPGMTYALGVCFGRVVTMDSPKARPPGEFQWEATLWHELAHVITLQLSKGRVPRWLTEGLSVYEERKVSKTWYRENERDVIDAIASDDVLTLKDINNAFRAMRDMYTGLFYVNAPTIGAETHLPFGGTKSTGNGHREACVQALEVFSEWKSIYVDYSGTLQRAQIDA